MDNPSAQSAVVNPEEVVELNPEAGSSTGTESPGGSVADPNAGQEKLYAGRFKTPEELEEHYKLSSQEGVRLSGELKRVMAVIQGLQNPQGAGTKPQTKGFEGFFDADTESALKWFIQNHLTGYAQSQKSE